MKKTEYQNEVGSIRLSEQFKADLKVRMLEEYNKAHGAEPAAEEKSAITMSSAGSFAKKYSKYAAIAACLLIAVSTVSVLGVKGLQSRKQEGTDNNHIEMEREAPDISEQTADGDEVDEVEDDSFEPQDTVPESTAQAESEDTEDVAEAITFDAEDEPPPPDTIPGSNYDNSTSLPAAPPPVDDSAKYSEYASKNYSGAYNGNEYVNSAPQSGEGLPKTDTVTQTEIMTYPVRVMSADEIAALREGFYDEEAIDQEPEEAAVESQESAVNDEPVYPGYAVGSSPSNGAGHGGDKAETTEGTDNEEEGPQEGWANEEEGPALEAVPQEGYGDEEEGEEVDMPVEVPQEGTDDTNPGSWFEGREEESAPVDGTDCEEEAETAVEEEAEEVTDMPEPELEVTESTPATDEPAKAKQTNYSDYKDSLRGSLMPMGLVRFTIDKVYDSENLSYTAPGIYIDIYAQTLYRVNINYDYFGGRAVNVDCLMIANGNNDIQEIGRPVMQGEYISLLTKSDEGVLWIDPELTYKVYNVGGLELAYHLISDHGDNIDPGDTNMGLLPSEALAFTTSSNNPERYCQKAAVSELTGFLAKDLKKVVSVKLDLNSGLLRPNERLTATYDQRALKVRLSGKEVFPDTNGVIKSALEDMGAEIGEKSCTVITKEGNEATFEAGELTGLDIITVAKPFYIDVNGVVIGDSIHTAFEKLRIGSMPVDPDLTLTLNAYDGWKVTMKFDNYVLVEIVVKK